jgi:hypothetical protein
VAQAAPAGARTRQARGDCDFGHVEYLYVVFYCLATLLVSLNLASLHKCMPGSCKSPTFWLVVASLVYSQIPVLLMALFVVLLEVSLILQAILLCTSKGSRDRGGQRPPPHVFLVTGEVLVSLLVLGLCAMTMTGLIGMRACAFQGCQAGLGANRSLGMVVSGYVVNTFLFPLLWLVVFGEENNPRYPRLLSSKRWQQIRPVQVQDSPALPV